MEAIALQLIYDGAGPVHWHGGAGAFGLQDRHGALHGGTQGAAGAVVFDFTVQVKSLDAGTVVLCGDLAHGSPAGRFLYLSWADTSGGFSRRLKLPLSTITPAQVREALAKGTLLAATLLDHPPKATNIGGTRQVEWILA